MNALQKAIEKVKTTINKMDQSLLARGQTTSSKTSRSPSVGIASTATTSVASSPRLKANLRRLSTPQKQPAEEEPFNDDDDEEEDQNVDDDDDDDMEDDE